MMCCRRTTDADIPRLKEIWSQGFADGDSDIDRFFAAAYPRCQGFAAEVDGVPVSALYALPMTLSAGGREEKCAYLYAVSTDPRWRGRGLCRTLTAFAGDALAAQGFACAMLVPAEPALFGFYETMGYRPQYCHTVASRPAAKAEGRADAVDAQEYGLLRESLLRDISHLRYDEGWLRFTGAKFYALSMGGRTGCAAVCGGRVLEILPDGSLLAALAGQLGGGEILFRAPGGTQPFAMAKWLRGAAREPVYLAFAYE